MLTLATQFSGGEGFATGAMLAGLTPLWGVEHDDLIAGVAEHNTSSRIIRARAQDVDYSTLETPYWFHTSPPCTNASVAKEDASEQSEDVEMGRAVARAISTLLPPMVSLENVWGYRKFEAFKIILRALQENGYSFNYWHLNSADYGVPQTRKRLILIASRTHRPEKPKATHHDPSKVSAEQGSMFARETLPWVGWYAAIEDLIPGLPESKFADWQLKRLAGLDSSALIDDQQNGFTGGMNLVSDGPSFTVGTRPAGKVKAFIVEPDVAGARCPSIRYADEPMVTLKANAGTGRLNPTRAFIAHPNADNDWFLTRDGDEPVFTIKANGNGTPRAFIVDSQNTQKAVLTREDTEPSFTVTAHNRPSHLPKAWLSHGRVVSMTPRALARFQSFPDTYILPDSNSLACRVIGNAVPPLWAKAIIEANT
jgi:DNA (cytosine-5)-methyltransferase 1